MNYKMQLNRLGWRTTCRFNLLHNLHKLGPLLPIHGANNIIMASRIINPTFPPTIFKVVVSVINPTYHIRNLLINKVTITKHIKGPETTELDTPLAVKWSNHLTLRDRQVGLGMHNLAALPPTLNERLELVILPWFSSTDWAWCRPSFYLLLCSSCLTLTLSSSL